MNIEDLMATEGKCNSLSGHRSQALGESPERNQREDDSDRK